jgi:drug/metabolite transporter (DMT)-like permease
MRRSYLICAAVTAGWGTIPVVAGQVTLPSSLIVAARVWTAALGLGTVLLWRRRRDRISGRPSPPALLSVRPGLCVGAGAVLALHWLALFAAYRRAPAGTVILIVYLAPIGVAAVAPRLLGERLTRRTVVALAAATGGFALLAGPAFDAAGIGGLGLALLSAASFVVVIVVSKPLAQVYGGLQLAFLEMVVAGVILVPVAALARWSSPSPAWLWLVVLGLVHTALAIAIYLQVLAELPAVHVGILGYLEPVGVVICAWMFLGQRPATATALGGVLVVGAGVAVVLRSRSAQLAEVPAVPVRDTGRAGVPSGR